MSCYAQNKVTDYAVLGSASAKSAYFRASRYAWPDHHLLYNVYLMACLTHCLPALWVYAEHHVTIELSVAIELVISISRSTVFL
ncbi:hypothetical protein RRG08_059091 [Elysia crispata]|uniref:Uncharacterized protein n=1 Tax=Elysia crispata TaxID=231223 RepID=A0AAE1EBD3_9GAST|nr:hypothetical protein RRG08_059091 [Elysia crispata]